MLTELALYSDRLFMAAVGVYVLAMVLHGAEYAARARRSRCWSARAVPMPRPPSRPAARRATVPSARPDGRALAVLGAGLHLVSIVARGLAARRWPLGNMYEFTSSICLAAVVAWLVVLRRSPALRAGRAVRAAARGDPAVPRAARCSTRRPPRDARAAVVLAGRARHHGRASSSGLLLVPGVASLLYLLRRSGRLAGLADRLPAADVLDRLAYRTTIIAFPLYTFAVITGAIWAEAAWGRFWGWDPKETVAFVAWVIYAAYLHARATAGWRTGRAAWINVAGFAVVIFNLFFINMVVAGLHSYAGI